MTPDIDLDPSEYRDLARPKVRYTLAEFLSFGIASWFATQRRDNDFETRQLNAIAYGVGVFLVHRLKAGS